MSWTGRYHSPHMDMPAVTMGHIGEGSIAYSDEAMTSMIVGMILGKDWEIADIRDGWVLLKQRPPHQDWEWEFTRQDA
jgi:hypothetical protein